MKRHHALGLLFMIMGSSVATKVFAGSECDNPRFTLCPGDTVVFACDAGEGPEAIVNYPTPVAEDDCGPMQAYLYTGVQSGTSLPPGDYEVEWRTPDDHENLPASCRFTIKVRWRPTISCPPDTIVRACGRGDTQVFYALPTAFDDCGPIPVYLESGRSSGAFFPLGDTRVEYRTDDENGSPRSCAFYVRVEWPRELGVCQEDTVITICPGLGGVNVDYIVPQAFDDCGPVEMELTHGNPSDSFFPVGSTFVRYESQPDEDDNVLECMFYVRVFEEDEDPPQLLCPASVTAAAAPGQTSAIVTWESEASDSCPGPVTVECEPSSGSTFPCGTTTVTCTATDYSDNVSQCTFPVIVGIPVSVDVRPGTCPNPFKTTEQGLVPVVIHGTRTFDVTTIDPASVTLEGIPAVRWTLEDAGAPYEPYTGKDDCLDCSTAKKDRIRDLALKFDAVALADAMGEVTHGECRAVQLTGLLSTGCPVVGEDILKILALPEVGVEPAAQTPEVAPAELSARNPNPFRSGDRIEYALPLSGRARLVIYDVLGRMVRVLADGEQAAGQHHLAWDGRDEAGARVTNGLYFYILTVSPEDGSGVRMEKQRIVLTR